MSPQQVYDFLYVDVKRIARLVAQLDGKGILQETTRELAAGADVENKFNLLFWQIAISPKATLSKGSRYDPSWRLPVVFLDEMRRHIVSDPKTWEIGQIVTLTGAIAFRDFAFARELLRVDAIQKLMLQDDVGTESMLEDKQLALFRNAAEALPHMLQTYVTDGAITTWSTVNDAFTTASTGDLILKCGGNIQGAWTITGVLDAMANDGNSMSEPEDSGGGFSTEFRIFGNAVRSVIGRPASCYGVTPLTIHRKVEVPKFSNAG